MMEDIGIPLAHAGRALVFEPWMFDLAETNWPAWVELMRHRYVANLFSPMWGVLFEGDEKPMTETITSTAAPKDGALVAAVTAAQEKLTKLQEAAADADAEATRWKIAFEREPTVQSDGESRVAAQKAINAHALVAEAQVALERAQAEKRAAELAAAKAQIAAEQEAVEKRFAAACAAIAAAAKELNQALDEFGKHSRSRMQSGAQKWTLTSVIKRLALRLEGEPGAPKVTAYDYTFGNEPRVEVSLKLPTRHVPMEAQ